MKIARSAEGTLRRLYREYPVVVVTGPRQSGKTTLVRMVFRNKPYVSLEDLDEREFANEDPRGFLERYPHGAILDEAQHSPGLFSYIQTRVDNENRSGVFVLTGSQQFGLLSGVTQSLAGRAAILSLLPFTLGEIQTAGSPPSSLQELLVSGLYPPIYDRNADAGIWYGNYVRTYLERDVRQILQVRDLSTFQRFLRMCAGRSGQLVNLSALANDCGVTHNTAKAWLSVLEASYILYFLRPHHNNFNKRLIKTPKLYFYDTGLLVWLLGIDTPQQVTTHPLYGAIFETWVVGELLKARLNRGQEPRLSFWQDHSGHEIDVLVERSGEAIPVEIKAGQTVASDFFKGLELWKTLSEGSPPKGYIVYGGNAHQKRGHWHVIPWSGIGDLVHAI